MPDHHEVSSDARRRLLSAMPVTERRLELAGISTAVLEGGEGSPLVLLHGPAGNAAHWMRMIPALIRTHRVIAPDLPGHGASATFDGKLDVPRVLAWLAELIEQTSEAPPVLVGHLLGGAIVARLASEQRAQLAGLVLVDTFGLSEFAPLPEFGAAVEAFLAAPTRSSHRALWRYCAHDFDRLERTLGERWQDYEDYALERARSTSFRDRLSTLLNLFGQELTIPQLQRIAVPTALVWGRHDLATPLSVAEAASTRLGWPLHVIENANDDPPFEQPEALVSVLRIALAKTDGSRSERLQSSASRAGSLP